MASDSDYAYLREVVLNHSANLIDPSRNALFDTRLTPLAQLAGLSGIEDLVSVLRSDRPAYLHRAVAEAMTINETSFFRDVRPFELLRQVVLPRLIQARASRKHLRIWSAACSTGQEPYTIAMLLAEHFPQLRTWDIEILGSDISQHVVDYAHQARFRRIEVNRGLPARLLVKYFERRGEEWQLIPAIRNRCSFQVINLCAPLPQLPTFDIILLRNVLLYFPQQDRSCVLTDIYRHLAPDGCLLLGCSEQAEDSTDLFQVQFALDACFYHPAPNPFATTPSTPDWSRTGIV